MCIFLFANVLCKECYSPTINQIFVLVNFLVVCLLVNLKRFLPKIQKSIKKNKTIYKNNSFYTFFQILLINNMFTTIDILIASRNDIFASTHAPPSFQAIIEICRFLW